MIMMSVLGYTQNTDSKIQENKEKVSNSTQADSVMIDQYILEGVVVSAQKRKSTVMEVPVSVTSLSHQKIENSRIVTSTDLTGIIPNLYMPDYGSKLTSPIYIRGIGSRINAPSVGFYIDQVDLFDKATFNFDMYDIERIEVLRGPQGTLYGRNTLGGIVHVFTKDPTNSLGIKLHGEIGNYGHQHYQLRVGGPLIKDKLFIQVSGNFKTRTGYLINQFNNQNLDWLNSGGGRMKMIYNPTSRSNMVFQVYTDNSREGGYPYSIVEGDNSLSPINYDHVSTYDRDIIGTNFQYDWKGDKIQLNIITSYQNFSGLQDIDQDFTPADLLSVTVEQAQQLFTQEVRISNPNENSKLKWVTGLYGFYQPDYRETGVTYGNDGITAFNLPFNSYSYIKNTDITTYGLALFGQGFINDLFIEGLEFTAGIRIDYEEDVLDYVYDRYINENVVPTEDTSIAFNFFEILPKFSLQYNWSSNQMNYLSVTRGYKSGGFNTTFERDEDKSFNPEYSWNYELGWKGSFNNKANVRFALFYIDWKDLQVYQPVPSGRGSMLKNAASAYSHGVELEVDLIPVKNFRVSGNFGYADAKFTEYLPDPEDQSVNYDGNSVPYVPDLTGFLSASYRLPLNSNWFHDLVFSANWREIGKVYWNDANEYSQDAYGLMGANISIGMHNFILRVWAENLLDNDYRSFQFTAIGNEYAQAGRPRLFGLTLSYNL